jgi:hypothetical protein
VIKTVINAIIFVSATSITTIIANATFASINTLFYLFFEIKRLIIKMSDYFMCAL